MDTDISQKMGNYGNQSKDGDTKKDVNCNTPPPYPQKKLEGGEGGRRRSFSCKKTSAVSEEKGRVVGMGGRAGLLACGKETPYIKDRGIHYAQRPLDCLTRRGNGRGRGETGGGGGVRKKGVVGGGG